MITVRIYLNVAVFSGTFIFVIAKRIWKISDVEEEFALVESEDLMG